MGTWLKRNTSKKYVLNQEERSMDVLLEVLLDSPQPEGVKAAFITRVCEQGASNSQHPATTVRGVLEVACKWSLHGTTSLQVSSGFRLLNSWGSSTPPDVFLAFFTPELVLRLLHGKSQTNSDVIAANVPLLLREGFRVMSMSNPPMYQEHAQAVQTGITDFVHSCAIGDRLTVRNTGLLLREFPQGVPTKDAGVLDLCIAILEHLAKGVPPQDKKMILKFIKLTDEIAIFLNALWTSRPQSVLEACLGDIFHLISTQEPSNGSTDTDRENERPDETPICLASVVQYIPMDIANRVVKEVVTDPSIPEATVEHAVSTIVEWLKWPSGRNVDRWLSCFLTELAAHHKFSLLARITDMTVEQVVENLLYLHLRQASFKILSQMLLSYQHSPGPFHKAIEKIVVVLSEMQRESKTSHEARVFLNSLAGLLHCLMHQHSGFPELYDPVLTLIKDCPTPTPEEIKSQLIQSCWLSQVSGSFAMDTSPAPGSTFVTSGQKKLEEGKTGLDNLGNTCYMNSVIQALYMCDQFRRGILTKMATPHESLLEKLQQVFALLCQSNRASTAPRSLLQASRPPWFVPGQQQDCSEFLKYLLDRLHEDESGTGANNNGGGNGYMRSLSSSSNASIGSSSPGGTLRKSERKAAAVTLTSIKMKTDDIEPAQPPPSLIENAFKGKVETTLRCLACSAESKRMESFSDIPLAFPNWSHQPGVQKKSLVGGAPSSQAGVAVEPIQTQGGDDLSSHPFNESPRSSLQSEQPSTCKPGGTSASTTQNSQTSFSLNDLLAFYLKTERLSGDNKYHCDRCGCLQDGERSINIANSPSYLILSLLRFSYDTNLHTRTKIFEDVHYPLTLAVPVTQKTSCCVVTSSTLTSRHGSSSSLKKLHQHSRNNSSGSYIYNNNNDDNSSNLQDAVYQEKLRQLAQRLCPKIENSSSNGSGKLLASPSNCGSSNLQQECELYGLSAVIIHSGTSSECGHYYCYARHSHSGQIDVGLLDSLDGADLEKVDLLPDQWYNFNDSRVSHAKFETFSNVTKRFSKDTAYVLIYRKLELHPRVISSSLDPALRPELRDFVIKDNEAFLKEQEMDAKVKEEQRRRSSSVTSVQFQQWTNKKDDEDDDEGGGGGYKGCGPAMGGGLDTSGSRFVF